MRKNYYVHAVRRSRWKRRARFWFWTWLASALVPAASLTGLWGLTDRGDPWALLGGVATFYAVALGAALLNSIAFLTMIYCVVKK